MKIRSGFVSNSSSSSFVLIGERIKLEDIDLTDKSFINKSGKYDSGYYAVLSELSEDGDTIIKIENEEYIDVFKKSNELGFYANMDFYKVFYLQYEGGMMFNTENLPLDTDVYIECGQCAQGEPDSAEDLEQMMKGEY